jgi:arylsulfatase A
MRAEEVTIAEIFKDAGYATGCFGKWHNGAHFPQHPNGQGFDEFFGFCGGHWNNYFDTQLESNGKMVRSKGYISDVLTDAAIRFIEKNKDRPFFCYIPYNAPHSPWQVPAKYYRKYEEQGMTGKLACAYGMVENLDDNIGRLRDSLEALELTESTILVFLTDNGPNTDRYNGGMRGRKGSLHEGGVRVPLFFSWPGRIKPGIEVEQIAAHIDILPTLMELSGVSSRRELSLDGWSLMPLLTMSREVWEDRMLFDSAGGREVTATRGSVRTQKWRAVRYGEWELYDMVSDPVQERNLASEHADVVEEMAGAYEDWFDDVTAKGFDVIPISVGLEERPEVVLPGHEAFLYPAVGEGISYHRKAGYANDWVDNWQDTNSYPYWKLEVVQEGTYEVTLMYTCAEEDLGSRIRVEAGSAQVEGVVSEAHDPDPIPSPDYVPRGEVYEKVWAPLKLGALELEEGRTKLAVRAVSIKGSKAMELKSVVLSRRPDPER